MGGGQKLPRTPQKYTSSESAKTERDDYKYKLAAAQNETQIAQSERDVNLRLYEEQKSKWPCIIM